VEVVLKPCDASARISTVALKESSHVLWEIRNEAGSDMTRFEVGSVPNGYAIVTPLTTTLDENAALLVTFTLRDQTLHPNKEFRPRELKANEWLTSSGKRVSDEELAAISPC